MKSTHNGLFIKGKRPNCSFDGLYNYVEGAYGSAWENLNLTAPFYNIQQELRIVANTDINTKRFYIYINKEWILIGETGFVTSDYSKANHNHDLAYSTLQHNHDLAYSTLQHNHDNVYPRYYGELATEPETPIGGDTYKDSVGGNIKFYDGTIWIDLN